MKDYTDTEDDEYPRGNVYMEWLTTFKDIFRIIVITGLISMILIGIYFFHNSPHM